jgi:hypothetical protein
MFPRFDFKVRLKIKEYFKDNPGAPFVIGFQLLLVVCAGLLIQGSSVIANEVATYAYFLLVVGVVLQLIAYVRHRNNAEEEHDNG